MASGSSWRKTQHTYLDLKGIQKNQVMWLVKVPKYLSQLWSEASSTEVGRLKIDKNQKKPRISFTLREELTNAPGSHGQSTGVSAPRDHQFFLEGVRGQLLAVLTEDAAHKCSLEGTVVHRVECRAAASDNYLRLKRVQIQEACKPTRITQKLDKVVTTNYRPVADHQHNIEHEKKKKERGKRVRADKEQVLAVLFAAFEKHQYYNIKDLVNLTLQPVVYLKEILNEIGIRNMKGPHKGLWELKPEYRHYPTAPRIEPDGSGQ
ncbi:general transcription factor IIF subunit 2-like [Sorex fumeus]|uniref:general transcription factor IIF subunit 2-like n=1 Tax=Sorex fumeus TaxID=62283 RepID=UPI0024AD897C|nr:general transcription factor IIF subunit 2-like [Sorex fumeus]